jgi:hypothetical protein
MRHWTLKWEMSFPFTQRASLLIMTSSFNCCRIYDCRLTITRVFCEHWTDTESGLPVWMG